MARASQSSVSVRDFRANLPRLLKRVSHGASLVVTSRGRPIARIVPPDSAPNGPRPFGLMKGQICMAPDFDDTPEDVVAAMEKDLTSFARR